MSLRIENAYIENIIGLVDDTFINILPPNFGFNIWNVKLSAICECKCSSVLQVKSSVIIYSVL